MAYFYQGQEIFPIVEVYHDVVPYLGGITMREFFTDGKLCARAWGMANEKIDALLGEYLPGRKPALPPLSYGHLVCLGAQLKIPVDGEPNIAPPAHCLDEAITILQEQAAVDFRSRPIFRQYYDLWQDLKAAFPEQDIPFSGLGLEGPITSAELFRGQDFFMDAVDEPEKVLLFLQLMTDSIIRFSRFSREINGLPPISTEGVGLADDFASMIPPYLWETLVIPFWNQYYAGLTSAGGRRWLHCENTSPDQLDFLELAGIDEYQPSVAGQLTLENIKAHTSIPFDWLLYAFHIVAMSDEEIQAWVDKAVAAGVTRIRTQFGRFAWQDGKMDRILAFYRAFDKYRV
ncbi:MAG: uroporphyrinogen decarboxylase family protein [Clostridiaceae bacterium]|nr:uroporphyrinogen decarboxylase family protein [Clostridiaceae bacterium]